MLFNAPLSTTKADRLVDLCQVATGARVLDVGCGTGEFLMRVVQAKRAFGVGIDSSAKEIAKAQTAAETRLTPNSYQFRAEAYQDANFADAAFDLAICIGATHAFADADAAYPTALQTLTRLVRSGGQILIGEGFWQQPPAPEYRALLGEPAGIYNTHAENIFSAEKQSLIPLYATTSNTDEWDDFEWSHRMAFEQKAINEPNNAELAAQVLGSRQWRDGYLRWGRDTMGFGFYLFQKP